ncbi:hypothetical protein MED121_16919 [Marinomonas sp. MED121]|nr:hypothetical protein MED121_16919 [Marinomonas sp. MED121]
MTDKTAPFLKCRTSINQRPEGPDLKALPLTGEADQ